uniref:hypothetical protein n=1 Tax=Actinomyces radicidentis TaxID=111015 RepID=UPI0028E459C8
MTSTNEPRPGRPRTAGSTDRDGGSAARSAAALRAQRAARARAGAERADSSRPAGPARQASRRRGVPAARTGRPDTRTAARPPAEGRGAGDDGDHREEKR